MLERAAILWVRPAGWSRCNGRSVTGTAVKKAGKRRQSDKTLPSIISAVTGAARDSRTPHNCPRKAAGPSFDGNQNKLP